MMTRRDLLASTAKLAAAGYFLRGAGNVSAAGMRGLTCGVQLFMVRKLAETDLAAAFKAIKDAGYDSVELFPIAYHQPAAQVRKLVAHAGLECVSGLFDYDGPRGRETSVEYAHALGLKYVVCPTIPESQRLSLDGFSKTALYFSQWGEEVKKAGMQFALHNQNYEFKPIDGSSGWDILMRETDASTLKLELDLYWLAAAGQDPMAILKKHADRTVVVHLKDRAADAPVSFLANSASASYCTELGKGTIDWPALLAQARRQGIVHAFLDQDRTSIPVPESLRQSREYLRKLSI